MNKASDQYEVVLIDLSTPAKRRERYLLAWKMFGVGLLIITAMAVGVYFVWLPYFGKIWSVICAVLVMIPMGIAHLATIGSMFPEFE